MAGEVRREFMASGFMDDAGLDPAPLARSSDPLFKSALSDAFGGPLTKSANVLSVNARVRHRESGQMGKVRHFNSAYRGRNVAVEFDNGDLGLFDADELLPVT